jgi:hypothetical protein
VSGRTARWATSRPSSSRAGSARSDSMKVRALKGSAMPLTCRPMEVVVFAVAWVRAGLAARPHRSPAVSRTAACRKIRAKVLS